MKQSNVVPLRNGHLQAVPAKQEEGFDFKMLIRMLQLYAAAVIGFGVGIATGTLSLPIAYQVGAGFVVGVLVSSIVFGYMLYLFRKTR